MCGSGMMGRLRGVWMAVLLLAAGGSASAQYRIVRSFSGAPANDGSQPYGALTMAGPVLYGMTYSGGTFNTGVVFRVGTNGLAYTNLHAFAGGTNDGSYPYTGAVVADGALLYGAARYGGVSNQGVVFALGTNGSGFNILHQFTGGTNDGRAPSWPLTPGGSAWYSVAGGGGAADRGVVFRLNADGSGYTNLHAFGGSAQDGNGPNGGLRLIGSALYGLTALGGVSNFGVVFRLNTDGSGYTNLHAFTGGADGVAPKGALAFDGAFLYGTASGGGVSNAGIAFRLQPDGTGYTNLHAFAGYPTDGSSPNGTLLLDGVSLYGTTLGGGSANCGIVFKLAASGEAYANLHTFTGPPGDGDHPDDALVQLDSVLYGMTVGGGAAYYGTVFALSFTPDPQATITRIECLPSGVALGWQPNRTNLRYTVEANTGLVDTAWFAVPPTSQWWIAATAWTNSPATPPGRFFRIRLKDP